MHSETPEHALKANLEWLSYFKLNEDEEKLFLWCASVWLPMLLEQFQSSARFNSEHKNTYPFLSHIGSSIPKFRDMYLHSIV